MKALIHSKDTRILPSLNLTKLLGLLDSAYDYKEVRFHLDLKSAVEVTSSSYFYDDDKWMSSEMAHESNFGTGALDNSIQSAYDYVVDAFVALGSGGNDNAFPFWIGRI